MQVGPVFQDSVDSIKTESASRGIGLQFEQDLMSEPVVLSASGEEFIAFHQQSVKGLRQSNRKGKKGLKVLSL